MGYERDIYKKNIIFRNIGSCDTEYSLSMFNTRFRIIQGSPWQRFYCYTVRVTSTYVNSAYYTLNLSIRYLPIAGCTFTKCQWVFFAFFPISFSHKIAAVILKIIWKLRYTTITHQNAYLLTGFDSSDFIRHM